MLRRRRTFPTTPSWTDLKALAAAALALFSWRYFPYWVTLDAFALFTLAATAVFVATSRLLAKLNWKPCLLLGFGCALGHLARADGALLFFAAAITIALRGNPAQRRGQAGALASAGAFYALFMLPWFLRNIAIAGTPILPGGLQTVFLREYNNIFTLGVNLDAAWYLADGMVPVLTGKLIAGLLNLGTIFGLQLWLLPFSAVAWFALRRSNELAPVAVYGILLYTIMTLVFTFPGVRGALVHSSVALVPWFSIACIDGLERTVQWAATKLPQWNAAVAFPRFAALLIGLSAGLSYASVIERSREWRDEAAAYQAVAAAVLADNPSAIPLLNNPPAWWYFTRGPAMQNPSNGLEAAVVAAQTYGGTHIVLEPGRSREWREFVRSEATDPRLVQISGQSGYRVYRLVLP
ncbi:MAG: hypothetical protein EXR51_04325 [Dehalococcoidia bacterium]|nr:hypothetical protein [Dehalococcoidia bacterium]